MTDLQDFDRPPTYAVNDPLHPTITINHLPDLSQTFSNPSLTASHTYGIHQSHTSQGLNVTHGEHQMYYIGRYDHQDRPELAIYGGYDAYGPQLALAEFGLREKDFHIYLGGLKHPGAEEWDTVRHATDGRMFHHNASYRFDASSRNVDGERTMRRLHWKKTHESKLGASYFSMRDFKLVDESDDEVVAVYTEHGREGRIEFRRKMEERVEIAALITLMAIVERMKRVARGAAKAIGGGR